LAERLEGTAISIDPGEHEFVFETAGQPALKKRLLIQEAQKDRRESVVFGSAAAPAAGASQPQPESKTSDNSTTTVGTVPSADSTRRTIGFAAGGVGVLCLGLAIYEQATALGRASDSRSAAANPDVAVQATAAPIHDQAGRAQTYAIASGLLGTAAVATGLYFVLSPTHPHTDKASTLDLLPQLGMRGGGLALQGAW
jgi:hypothetical protein